MCLVNKLYFVDKQLKFLYKRYTNQVKCATIVTVKTFKI